MEEGFRLLLIRNDLLKNLLKKAGITPPEFIAPKFFNYVVTQNENQTNDNLDDNEQNCGNKNDIKLNENSTNANGKEKNSDPKQFPLKDNDKKVFLI